MKVLFGIIFYILLIQCSIAHPQLKWGKDTISKCNCTQLYNYIIHKVENDYLNYTVKTKNRNNQLSVLTKQIKKKIHRLDQESNDIDFGTSSYGKCYHLISQWLGFFNDPHLVIYADIYLNKKFSDKDILKFFSYADTINFSIKKFYTYINTNQQELHPLEGFWTSKNNRHGDIVFGIKKHKNIFIGFALTKDSVFWSPKQVRFIIQKSKSSQKEYNITYYDRFHTPNYLSCKQINNIIEIERVGALYKLIINNTTILDSILQLKAIPKKTNLQIINEQTVLLTLPSFSVSRKQFIDSLLNAHDATLKRIEHLIIDVRGNTGGTIRCFDKLLPILYTKPIYVDAAYALSNKSTQEIYEKYYQNAIKNRPDRVQRIKTALENLKRNPGKFVITSKDTIIKFDTIYTYPKHISVLIDEATVSAGELFVLKAMQSEKTTIYGKPTNEGIELLDNDVDINFPSKLYWLYYPLAKLAPYIEKENFPTRLKPDVEISYQEEDWVKFVIEYPNKKFINSLKNNEHK